jgi:hypothetical protein
MRIYSHICDSFSIMIGCELDDWYSLIRAEIFFVATVSTLGSWVLGRYLLVSEYQGLSAHTSRH